jgi:hypothetical protein
MTKRTRAQTDTLQLSIHFAKMSIHEPVLSSNLPLAATSTAGYNRLPSLCACLAAVKSFMDVFSHIPTTAYAAISFPLFSQLANTVVTLRRLSVLDDPAWDRRLVRDTVDILVVLDMLVARFEEASRLLNETAETDVGRKAARMFRGVRAFCGLEMAPINATVQDGVILQMGTGPATEAVTGREVVAEVGDGEMMDLFGDDTWMRDVFGFNFSSYAPLG